MLDAFTAVLSREADRKEAEDALTAEMMNLPISDLQKIASGMKLADLCSDDSKGTWLSKYEGTPLYDQALSLEEALIEVEAERVRRRMEEPRQEDLWAKEDMLRLKKRQLDLELVKSDQGKSSQVNLDDRSNNEPVVAKTGSVDKYILPANGVADALVGYSLSRREGLSIPQSIGFGALDAALGTGELAMARKGLHEKTAAGERLPLIAYAAPVVAGGIHGARKSQAAGDGTFAGAARGAGGAAIGTGIGTGLGTALGGVGGAYLASQLGFDPVVGAVGGGTLGGTAGGYLGGYGGYQLATRKYNEDQKTASADIDMAGRAMAHAMHKVALSWASSVDDAASEAANVYMPLYGEPHPSQLEAAVLSAQSNLRNRHDRAKKDVAYAQEHPIRRYVGPTLVGGGLGSLFGAAAGSPSLKGLGIGAGIGGALGAGLGALAVPSVRSLQSNADLQGQYAEQGSDTDLMRALIQQQAAVNKADHEHDRRMDVARAGATNVNVHNHSRGHDDDEYKYAHAAMEYAIKEAFGPAIAMGARAAAPAVANAARAALPAIGNAAKSVLGGGSGSFLSQVGNSLAVNKATEAVSNLMK